jgi:non-heme chloroperoxidase
MADPETEPMPKTLRCVAAPLLALAVALTCAPALAARSGAPPDRFVTVAPGVKIRVIEAGPPAGGERPTLVLIPGWRLTAAVWQEQIARFSKTRRVISIDPRSQGASTKTAEGDTPEQRARDLHLILQTLCAGPIVLVGWSQGVQDVAAYVDQFGVSGVTRIVLVDSTVSAGAATPPAATAQQLKQIAQFSRYPREATEGMFKAIIRRPLPKADIDRLVAEALKTPTAIGAAMLTDDLLGPDRTAALAKFTAPTLVIASATSPELDGQKAMAARLPHARFEAVADAAHAVFIDQPERFDALLEGFLSEGS